MIAAQRNLPLWSGLLALLLAAIPAIGHGETAGDDDAGAQMPPDNATAPQSAIADITTRDGARAGRVIFWTIEDGVAVRGQLASLPTGADGVLITRKGVCDRDEGFESAGGALPLADQITTASDGGMMIVGGSMMKATLKPIEGMPPGQAYDEDNSRIGEEGRYSLFDRNGAAFVIADGERRIGCGVIKPPASDPSGSGT